MKIEAEQRKLHQMAKVNDFLDQWKGSQTLRATQQEFHAQNEQMTALEYISDTDEIVKASWSLFQHDVVAAYKLSEKSPVLPAVSRKDLPGGPTQILNVHQIKWFDRHPAESDKNGSPEIIWDTEYWLNWKGDLDNPNESENDWEADNQSDIELHNASDESETPDQGNGSTAQIVHGLIRPIWPTKKMVEMVLMMVDIMETRRNKGIKTR